MTIGPEPITRTLLMSSRLGIRGCAPRESKRWLAAVDSRAQEPGSGRRDTRRRVVPPLIRGGTAPRRRGGRRRIFGGWVLRLLIGGGTAPRRRGCRDRLAPPPHRR